MFVVHINFYSFSILASFHFFANVNTYAIRGTAVCTFNVVHYSVTDFLHHAISDRDVFYSRTWKHAF